MLSDTLLGLAWEIFLLEIDGCLMVLVLQNVEVLNSYAIYQVVFSA